MKTTAGETRRSSGGAVDLRVTSRDELTSGDVISGRPLDLRLSGGLSDREEEKLSTRRDASTPPDTPTSPVAVTASAFKKTMLRRYSKQHLFFS